MCSISDLIPNHDAKERKLKNIEFLEKKKKLQLKRSILPSFEVLSNVYIAVGLQPFTYN